MSLDAGLRMDGIPTLDLCDLVIEVLHSSFNPTQRRKEQAKRDLPRNKPSNRHFNIQTKIQSQDKDLELSNVDDVSAKVKPSQQSAMLYISEDDEAVIKMITQGQESNDETCFQNPQSCARRMEQEKRKSHCKVKTDDELGFANPGEKGWIH